MDITVHKEFNEIFETASSIHLYYHPERKSKEVMVKNSDIPVDTIHKKFQPFLDRYYDVFKENFTSSDNDPFFFEDYALDWMITIAEMVAKNSHWLVDFANLSEEEVYREIVEYLFTEKSVGSMDEIIAKLEEESLPFHICWKWILILKSPKKYLRMYIKIINNNLQAYQKARAAVDGDVAVLLKQFTEPPQEFLARFTTFIKGDYEFYPTLCNPFLMSMTEGGSIFCGLYMNELIEREVRKEKPRETLAGMFKMLADRNKIEILFMLKEESMYNLQIAGELGISAATTTHHMTSLLTRGFVAAEKREGKVYYTLQREQIKEAIADLEAVFL